MPPHPLCHLLRIMHPMIVNNQKYLPLFAGSYEPSQKFDKYLRIKPLPKNHEFQLPPVAYGRYHVEPKSLAAYFHHWSLTIRGPTPSCLMVRPDPCLVSPVNLRSFLPSLLLDPWMFLLKPRLHFLRILLISPLQRLLRRKPPPPQIPLYRPYRELHPKLPLYELPHSKGQREASSGLDNDLE